MDSISAPSAHDACEHTRLYVALPLLYLCACVDLGVRLFALPLICSQYGKSAVHICNTVSREDVLCTTSSTYNQTFDLTVLTYTQLELYNSITTGL